MRRLLPNILYKTIPGEPTEPITPEDPVIGKMGDYSFSDWNTSIDDWVNSFNTSQKLSEYTLAPVTIQEDGSLSLGLNWWYVGGSAYVDGIVSTNNQWSIRDSEVVFNIISQPTNNANIWWALGIVSLNEISGYISEFEMAYNNGTIYVDRNKTRVDSSNTAPRRYVRFRNTDDLLYIEDSNNGNAWRNLIEPISVDPTDPLIISPYFWGGDNINRTAQNFLVLGGIN